MKTQYNQIVFQIIKKYDQACPHCFFNSSPKSDEKLTLSQVKKGLADIKFAGIKKDKIYGL